MTHVTSTHLILVSLVMTGVVAACGDSSSGEGGAGGDGSSSSSTSRSTGAVPTVASVSQSSSRSTGALPTSPSSTGAVPTIATTTAGGGTEQACIDYCTAIQANCTVANAQYDSEQACLDACALLAPGTAGDQTGNTIACRQYHADVAATTPVPHCEHAGPDGGGQCVD